MSRAKIIRPIDTLRRMANTIIRIKSQPDYQRVLGDESFCTYLAAHAQRVATGFYGRNLQHRFDAKMASAGPDA